MFCIYSSNESDLRLFAQSFKEACAAPLCLEDATRLRGVPRLVFSLNELKRVG